MFCDRILGNLESNELGESEIDWLDLTWIDCTRRALRRHTLGGTEMKLVLSIGQSLRHGDILSRDLTSVIAVNVIATKVLVAHPSNALKMGQLALELGNLHLPVEIAANEVTMIPDGPTEAILARMEIPFSTDIRRFSPELCSARNLVSFSDDFSMSRKGGITKD